MFKDKVVIVTGAGSGIGRGLAAGFCRDGARVVGFGRTPAALDETAAHHGQGRMTCVVGDLGRVEDVDRLFAEAIQGFGRVDIVVNNAAVYHRRLFLHEAFDPFVETMQANVIGMAYVCYKALPGMLDRGYGRILNVGSFAWHNPFPTSVAYAVSKAAVTVLTKGIAGEIDRVRHPDVLVNEFIPGIVKTSMSPNGDDPMAVYQHARVVAALPSGGPNGKVFLRSQLIEQQHGWKGRVQRMLRRVFAGNRSAGGS